MRVHEKDQPEVVHDVGLRGADARDRRKFEGAEIIAMSLVSY